MALEKVRNIINELAAIVGFPAAVVGMANVICLGLINKPLPILTTLTLGGLLILLFLFARKRILIIDKILIGFADYIIKPLIISPFYLLFGNLTNRRLLKDIHKTTIALQESVLFGRLTELRSQNVRYYHILYTHKDGHPPIGNLENYKMAGFPVDEAQMIMRLWYFLTNNLYLNWADIKPVCSCIHQREGDRTTVYKEAFSIIGSPKNNDFCKKFIEKLSSLDTSHTLSRDRRYLMKINDNNGCYVEENGNVFLPSPINPSAPPPPDESLTDYALIMKLPNILNDNDTKDRRIIFLFAGCKVGGQCGITEWFFTPENLADLTNKYCSKYFQIFFTIQYHYVEIEKGSPKIIKTESVWEEEIKYTLLEKRRR